MKEIEAALHQHINDRITQFMVNYAAYLTRPIVIQPDNAISSLPGTDDGQIADFTEDVAAIAATLVPDAVAAAV